MIKRTLLLSGTIALAGCAYALDTQLQDVQFITTGAQSAVCIVHINKLRYDVHPPETIHISKSEEAMSVDCKAPGNRRKKIMVPATIEQSTLLNAGNAGAGLPVDFLSRAMFKYPDVIDVDFTGIPNRPQALPAQNNPDIRQPEDYDLEEFRPDTPRLNSDKDAPLIDIIPRRSSFEEYESGTAGSYQGSEGEPAYEKGSLTAVIQDLRNKPADPAMAPVPATVVPDPVAPNPNANPGAAYGPAPQPLPVPLYDGE